jgi:hypothetical protein
MKLRELVVLTIVFFAMFAIGIKAVQTANETADVIACKANLAKLSQGVTSYETAKGYLPPFKVLGQYPGWNLRILPYMDYANVHNILVENNRYTLGGGTVTDIRTKREKDTDDLHDWLACEEALLSVTEFRHSQETVKTEIESEFATDENCGYYGVSTDFATPQIFTDFNNRYVTFTLSIFKLESPFEIYEVNRKTNSYWNTRNSEQWKDGKTNTLIVSEKYIPDWAYEGNDYESNIWNGGLQSLRGIPQASAQCIDTATTPIVQDGENPITQDYIGVHTRYSYAKKPEDKPVENEAWRGNYAWGSQHVGVIVAAMGTDQFGRSIRI